MTTTHSFYTEKDRWFDLLPKYLFLEPHLEGKRVLDIDCGAGWGSSLLARSAREVIALCADEDDLLRARSEAPHLTRGFQKLTPGDLPFVDGTFDAVLAFRGHWSFGELNDLTQEVARLLKPRGFFCIASPNPGQKTLPEILSRTSSPPALGFYEMQRRLGETFSQVRMVAQSPFFGFSMVDFSPEDPEAISLDPSLLEEGGEDASGFLALCSKLGLPRLDFSLIQLPLSELYPLLEGRAPLPPTEEVERVYEATIRRLKSQKAAILRDKEAWEARAEEAARRLKKLSQKQRGGEDTAALSSAQAELRGEREQAKERAAELEAALQSAQEKQASLEAERVRLERVALEHMGTVSEQRYDLQQKEERNVELRAKLVRLTTKSRELERQITEGRFTEKNLQTTLEKNEDAARDAEKRFRKMDEEIRGQKEQQKALLEEKERLAQELLSLKSAHARCQEEISEERHQKRSLEGRMRRAEHDASLQKEASEQAERLARALTARMEGTETQLASLQEGLEASRAELATASALLVDKDYLLAEAAARRTDAEWRAEETRQELTLTRSLSTSDELVGSLAAQAAEMEGAAKMESARAEETERKLDLSLQQSEIAQARILLLSQKLEEMEATRLDMEGALESSERRAASAKERAFAAARDATNARARLSQLEEELNTLLSDKESLSQKLSGMSKEARPSASAAKSTVADKPYAPQRAPGLLPSSRMTSTARRKTLLRLRTQARRQASLLLRVSLEKIELRRAIKEREDLAPRREEAAPRAPTPPALDSKGPEELARLYAQAASDLAASRAALEACRIARAEADRARALAEQKLRDALTRTREAEEARQSLQEKVRQQEKALELQRAEGPQKRPYDHQNHAKTPDS